MAWPILMVVSLTPSVSDQSAGHFVRSTVQPPGPVNVLPSADLPHPFSSIRSMAAVRCSAQSSSHSSIDSGFGGAVVDDVRRIRQHPLVPGRIPIYGYVYDVRSGKLNEVGEATAAGKAA